MIRSDNSMTSEHPLEQPMTNIGQREQPEPCFAPQTSQTRKGCDQRTPPPEQKRHRRPPALEISDSPRHSETSQVPRRPRSMQSILREKQHRVNHTCLCGGRSGYVTTPSTVATVSSLVAASSTTTTSGSLSTATTARRELRQTGCPSTPHHCTAVMFAAATVACLDVSGAARACDNATTLSSVLADVVSTLDDSARTFWCQMMDTLALRTAAGDVQYSVAIAPHLLWRAEEAYVTHEDTLRGLHLEECDMNQICKVCGGTFQSSLMIVSGRNTNGSGGRITQTGEGMEFSWVDDDDDETVAEGENTQRLPIPSFEAYICDVLDDQGKSEFVRERFYGGGALNSRYLLAKFGTSLGISAEEAALRAGDLLQEDAGDDFSEEEYMSGLSDTESLDRSDNGA